MCADIAPVTTRTRVVIVRHILEQSKNSNTGRLVDLMLENCAMLTHGEEGVLVQTAELEEPETYLLFPEGPVARAAPASPPGRIVVLDGTWKQARRMRKRIPAVRQLPIVSLPAPAPGQRRLRRPPERGAMATIESVAGALELFGEPDPARALRAAFELMIERSALAGHRRPPRD